MRYERFVSGAALLLGATHCGGGRGADGPLGSVEVRLSADTFCVGDPGSRRVPALIDSLRVDLQRGSQLYSMDWTATDLADLCASETDQVDTLEGVRAGKYEATLLVLDSDGGTLNDLTAAEPYNAAGNTLARVTGVPVNSGKVTPLKLRAKLGQGAVELDVGLDDPSAWDDPASGGAGGGGQGCSPDATYDGTVLALEQLSFGEGNSGQWKSVGFDLDGKVSTASSTDVCKPNAGGSASSAYPDGDQGIDNSFGKNILPILLGLIPTWTNDIHDGLAQGNFTTLLKPMCLPSMGDGSTLDTKLFNATALDTPPKWDGTDVWPVKPELLSDPLDPESSNVIFSGGSVTGSTYDAGNGTFVLSIPMTMNGASTDLRLTLHAARVTMTLAADNKSATGGRIGGVLDTEEFVAEVKKLGALANLCGSPILDSLLTQYRQASDIMSDGSQDPSKTCDGISIGLGFEMQAAQLGSVGPKAATGSSCP